MSSIIYHITTLNSWQEQKTASYYLHNSLEVEGFIHCCTDAQVDGVLERYFEGQTDLLLLSINAELLVSDLVYEAAAVGESFPHVYGAIEKAAIVNIEKLR